MDINLSQFKTAALENASRLVLGENNSVEGRGTSFGGRIAQTLRGWISNTRDSENQQIKESFLSAVRRELGSEAAGIAGREISRHRGLSSRTVNEVLGHLEHRRDEIINLHNERAPLRLARNLIAAEMGKGVLVDESFTKGVEKDFITRFGFAPPRLEPIEVEAVLMEGIHLYGSQTPGQPVAFKIGNKTASNLMAEALFTRALREGMEGGGEHPVDQVKMIVDNKYRHQALTNWLEVAGALARREPELVPQIREEVSRLFHGIASVDPGDVALFGNALKLKLVDSDMVQAYNRRQLFEGFESHVQKSGGFEGLYKDRSESFKTQFGIELSPWDPKMEKALEKELREVVSNSAGSTSFSNPKDFKPAQIDRQLRTFCIDSKWANGFESFPEKEMLEVLGNKDLASRQKNVDELATALERLEQKASKGNQETGPIRKAFVRFFELAVVQEPPMDLNVFLTAGIRAGLLPVSHPEAGSIFIDAATKNRPGNPTLAIRNYCCAERCFASAGEKERGEKVFAEVGLVIDGYLSVNGIKGRSIDLEGDRRKLSELRTSLVEKGRSVGVEVTSGKFRDFTTAIYRECLEAFGVNPDDQTMMLLGSGSRNEMFAYSDLEFAVLHDKNYDTTALQKALVLFEMRITALGETPLGVEMQKPIAEGFCFDPGGNSPGLGGKGFIGTPEGVFSKFAEKDLIEKEVLTSVRALVGPKDDKRFEDYLSLVDKTLQTPVKDAPLNQGQNYAIDNLKDQIGGIGQKSPIVTGKLEEGEVFDAKKLSRFPVFLASVLCKYHGVECKHTNTEDRLGQLLKIGAISQEEHDVLVMAFEEFGNLRTLAENHFKGQIHHVKIGGETDQEALAIDSGRLQPMSDLIEQLNGIYQKAVVFAEHPPQGFDKTHENL